MDNLIKITVFSQLPNGRKEYYVNTVSANASVKFPFEEIYKTLRLLYPKADFIEFVVG